MGIPTGESGCRRPKDANPAGDPPRRARARKGEATMNSRLYKVRKALKMSQVEFGREIGVSGAAISRIEKGERGLTEQMLKSVCREYHVRREWLTEGTGEMFRWDKSDLLERIAADPAFGLSREEILRRLDPADYIGCCPEQVDRFLQQEVQPVLDRYPQALAGEGAEIKV